MFAGEITYISSRPARPNRKPSAGGTVIELRSWADIERQQAKQGRENKHLITITSETVSISSEMGGTAKER